jgi:hypothetical protein
MKVSLSLILIVIVVIILFSHAFCGCCRYNMEGMTTPGNGKKSATSSPAPVKEGYTGLTKNIGFYSPYGSANPDTVSTSNWGQPDMTITPGKPLSPAVQDVLNRPRQPVPLPEGQMDIFFNTPFKPECCPNTYSNSQGCACMTMGQYNWLTMRGGNNVPYSQY